MNDETIPPPAAKRALLHRLVLPWWTLLFPLLGVPAVLLSLAKMGTGGTIAATVILIGSVLAAVHHAEVVAHRVGEPFGTLVLAVAVTVIEVSLIVSLMLSDAGDASTLAADTWNVRAYGVPLDGGSGGDDVFDVTSKSDGVGLNGIPYKDW